MSNSSPPPNHQDSPSSLPSRFWQWLRRPATLIGMGTAVVLIVGGSVTTYWLLRRELPSIIESRLGKFLDRPVRIGEFEELSLSKIRIGASTVPPTETDQDRASIKAIEIEYNLFALLTERRLPLTIKIIEPDIYLDENEAGVWLELNLPEEERPLEFPFDLQASANIEQAEVVLRPQALSEPIEILADVAVGLDFPREGEQQIRYDIDGTFADALINIEGETGLDQFSTQAQIAIADLSLVQLTALVDELPVTVTQGQLDVDLDVDIPSLDAYQASEVNGRVNLSKVAGRVALDENNPTAFSADLGLRLQQQLISIAQGKINFGDIPIAVSGEADLKQGYDIKAAVSPFTIDTAVGLMPDVEELPIPTSGEFAIDVQVFGAIDDPQLNAVLNATQPTEIDQIKLANTVVEVNADLNEIVLDRAEIIPATGGRIVGTGKIETNLQKRIQEGNAIDFTTMPLDFQAGIDLPLTDIASAYATLSPETRLGSLKSQVELEGTFKKPNIIANWELIDAFVEAIGKISGQGEARLDNTQFSLQDTALETRLGNIRILGFGNLETEKWEAIVKSQAVALDPLISELIAQGTLDQSVEALDLDIRVAGDGVTPEQIAGRADVTVAVDGRAIDLAGTLKQGILEGAVSAQQLQLQPLVSAFVPQFNVPFDVRRLQGNVSGNIARFLAGEEDLIATLDRLAGGIDSVLAIDQSIVDLNANLARGGQLSANVVSNSPLALTKFIPNLPVEAIFEEGSASVSSTISGLEQVVNSQNLAGLTAETALEFRVAEGEIGFDGQLQDGLWDANILVSEVNTNLFSRPVLANVSSEATTLALPDLNADFAFSGAANPILQRDRASVNIDRANIDWGQQTIDASGEAILADIFTAPDIAELELAVNAGLDFNSLATQEILNIIPVERQYLPQSLEIAGQSKFNGQITGKQLLQAPTAPNSIVLDGDIQLTNFQFNELVFDPVMAGTVNFATGQNIELALQGENDIIAASFDPCLDANCVAPYSLDLVELQYNEGQDDAILVFATGEQNRISATIENFPLSVFRIAPAQEFGLPGSVMGRVNAEADVNLQTFVTDGELEIIEPGIGTVGADELAIAFSYLNNQARLSQGRLDVGENRFNFQGNYNVASGAIEGNLTLKDGKIQDILAAANLSSLQDISRLTQPLDQGNASDLGTIALGTPGNLDLALYQETVNQIQARAMELRQSGGINQIDVRGDLELDANIAGTINNPQLDLAVAGRRWQVRPRSSILNYLPSIGLVIEDAGIIPIEQLNINANYENGVGTLEEANLTISRGTILAAGQLDTSEVSGNVEVENLPLDTILEFVPTPVDASGDIGLEIAVSGSPQNPAVEGEFSFSNASLQGRAIEDDFRGKFRYANSSLTLQTTNPEDIDVQVNGEIVLPPQTGFENRITADVNIGESGFNLLDALSLGQIEWVEGEGNIALSAETTYIDTPATAIDNLDASGEVTFEDAIVLTTALSEEVTINGAVALSEDGIQIEELQGTVDETDIAIAGSFPFFTPNPDSANPLTVTIDDGDINLENLYDGRTDANVTVQGTVMNPIIGGKVRLYDGQVFIPQTSEEARSPAYNRWFGDFAGLEGEPPVMVELDDFRVVLDEDFRLVSPPVYNFAMSGDFVLNGSPLDIPSLQSSGTIVLDRGEITLFNTDFFLSRLNENQVVFDPGRSLLNPNLNVEMGTTISDPSRIGQTTSPNEIRDDLARIGQSETLTVNLLVEGQAEQLLVSLGGVSESDASCEAGAKDFFSPSGKDLSKENLDREGECLSNSAIAPENGSNQQLLESPAIELTSSPPRSRSEIIELLGQQFIGLAEQLEQSSTQELLQFGVTEFLVEPLTRDVIFSVNEQATKVAQPLIKVDRARIYPELEGIYQLQEDAFIGVGYDYTFGEFKVRYEKFF